MKTGAHREGKTPDKSVEQMLSALLNVNSATSLHMLADASSSAAAYLLDAAQTLLYIDDGQGGLDLQTVTAAERLRSPRGEAATSGIVLPARIDPRRTPALAEALGAPAPTISPAVAFFEALATGPVSEGAPESGASSVALAPLFWGDERIGALLLLIAGTPELEAIRLFAEHVACAAASLRETSVAQEPGVLDVVRSVFDARKLESDLQKELARAVRYKNEVSIAVIEATNLRLLQERFGRALTGQLFDALGATLASNSRDVDSIGVYKESGYTMILTEAAAEGARTAAERLLAAANDIKLSGKGVPGLELHVACGWATCPADGVTSDAIFRAAERRMYLADEQVA